jgi:hypothetical protein
MPRRRRLPQKLSLLRPRIVAANTKMQRELA